MSALAVDSDWGPLSQPITHEVPDGAPPWRDNAYIIFWDQTSRLVGTLHVSTSPNAEGRRARLSLQAGGRSLEIVEELDPDTFSSDSVTFTGGSGFSVASKRVKGQIDTAPLFPIADYTGGRSLEVMKVGTQQPLMHYQRAAIVVGELQIDGKRFTANGHGFRDRTWGYREESSTLSEYFAYMWVFPEYAVTVMKVRGASGQNVILGNELRKSATVVSEVSMTRDASGLFAASRLELSDGREFGVRIGERRAGFWCPMGWERTGPTLSAFDEFVTLRASDGSEGFGLIEQGIVKTVF